MTYNTAVSIDWISYTVPVSKGLAWTLEAEVFYDELCNQVTGQHLQWRPEAPLHGYALRFVAVKYPGLAVMFSPNEERMGFHVIVGGSVLRHINAEGMLKYAAYQNGRITRLDVALDVGTDFDFRAFYDACNAGQLDTKARKCSVIESNSGTTVYIGSRSSESMLRVYNKAAEAGLADPLTRIELEIKGQRANAVAQYLCKHGLTDIPAIIRAFCDWPTNPLWTEIFAGIAKVGMPKAERQPDREKWIREQVRPALITAMREDSTEVKKLVAFLLHYCTFDQHDQIMKYQVSYQEEIPF